MPGILDFFDNPDFIASVMGGKGDASSFSPPPQEPPKPPPWDVMAKAPPTFGGFKGADPANGGPMNPGGFDAGLGSPVGMLAPTGPGMPQFGAAPPLVNGPVPMPPPNPSPEPRPPMPPMNPFAGGPPPQAKPMGPGPQPQKFEGGIFGGMGFKPDGWDEMQPPNGPEPGNGNPPPMVPEVDPAGPGNAMAFAPGAGQTRQGFPYTDPPGLKTGNGATPNRTNGDEITVNRTSRNGLDQENLNRDQPTGAPQDIRSPQQTGQADPRIERQRAFGNFMAALGKGLSAPRRPGAGKGASFTGAAGAALTGGSEHEEKNLNRDERGMDRAEKRRTADQTFDYHNRTLSSNQDYHNKLIEQHALTREENTKRYDADRDERSALARTLRPTGRETEDGRAIYYDQTTGRETLGENKGMRPGGANGQTSSPERIAKWLIDDAAKRGEKITVAEALKLARGTGNQNADNARLETIAQNAFNHQQQNLGNNRNAERLTLDQWRQRYGLPAFPQPRTKGIGADQNIPGAPPMPPPGPGAGAPQVRQPAAPPPFATLTPPGPATPPPAAAATGQKGPAMVPQWARQMKTPPGSHYSISKNAIITPDGQVIPAPNGP